jgi:methylated-DNA-[protein]-cysteine S-methyltransferase
MTHHDMEDIEVALRERALGGDEVAEAARRLARRAEAEGLVDVAYADVDTPIGNIVVASTRRGLVRVSFVPEARDKVLQELAEDLSPRVIESPARLDDVRRQLDGYFEGRLHEFELALDWQLSHGFARRVLENTARIPFGQVSSYKQMAAAAGSPRGARAAGNALGSNPIPIVVPCHRVLHSGGGIGGYGGGLDMKRFLLRLEGAWDK